MAQENNDEILGAQGANFVDAYEVSRLASLVTNANKDLTLVIGDVKDCIDSATALTEIDAPYSDEIVSSLRRISSSVASLAQQICDISGAAVLVSSDSLDEMIKGLRKQVVSIALANVSSD